MSKIKQTLIRLLPAKLFLFIKGYAWYGDFDNWENAKKLAKGYGENDILLKVKEALLKVKNGDAIYERDSVIFDKIEYSWELLSSLMWVAAQNKGILNVIDFGGSLGSTYYQNKVFIDKIPQVLWNIVEQPDFVREGKSLFENNILRFYFSIKECVNTIQKPIDFILLSSVLQYMEYPYKLLSEVVNLKAPYIFIDRTGFTLNGKDRITVQKVPVSIYKGSYPCWFLGEKKFYDFFVSNGYELIVDFNTLDKANIPSKYKGFIFQRKDDA